MNKLAVKQRDEHFVGRLSFFSVCVLSHISQLQVCDCCECVSKADVNSLSALSVIERENEGDGV